MVSLKTTNPESDDEIALPVDDVPEAPASPAKTRLLPMLLIGAAALVSGFFGVRYWQYMVTHISTNDAFLTANITQVAPQVAGTVTQVLVKEDQPVKAGTVLVQLDDSMYRAAVEQAQANLDAAIAQAKGAGIAVTLAAATGSAQIAQAQGGVDQMHSGIAGAGADLSRAAAGVHKAQVGVKAANSSVAMAQAALEAAQANINKARAAVTAAEAGVATAKASEKAAQAQVNAAQATTEKADRDADRYAGLLEKGAVSRQLADQASATARVTQAQLDSARQQAEMAKAAVAAREADVLSARQQVEAAVASATQAGAQLASAREMTSSAQADVQQAIAQQQAAQQGVKQAEARRTQALAQLQQAKTTPDQVKMSGSNNEQALARIAQARAALTSAQLNLQHTHIIAPVDGVISKLTVEVGAMVQPGTPLMALVQSQRLWVVANFKETQLASMRAGQAVDIKVDALGNEHFSGTVESISAGTGATFSLLPPDNATGNFTKVVQRVPVRIALRAGQRDIDRLRAGLSANVAVAIR